MSPWWQTLVLWLADFYVLATLLLTAAFAGLALVRQPTRRLAIGWAAMASLAVLAVLVAVPGWPRLPLNPNDKPKAAPANAQDIVFLSQTLLPAKDSSWSARPASTTTRADFDLVISEAELRRLVKVGAKKEGGLGKSASRAQVGTETIVPDGRAREQAKMAGLPAHAGEPVDWPALTAALFVTGATLALAWLALGGVQVWRLRRHGREASEALRTLLHRIVGDRRRCPRLLLSPHVGQPVAVGMLRPAILLPASSVPAVAEGQLEAVLAHEWAHIRRGDLWLLALCRWLLPLLFAHPLYWWLRGRIREDQEALADAAAAGEDGAIDYAATLLHWVRLGRKRRGAAAALALWGKPSELKRRITMLLQPRFRVETRCPGRWRWGALSAMGVCVLALSVLTLRPVPPVAAEAPPAAKPAARKKVPAKTVAPPARNLTVLDDLVDFDLDGTLDLTIPARPVPPASTGKQPGVKPGQVVKITGLVDNAAKKPVAQAAVTVIAWAPDQTAGPQVLAQGKTDAKGRYQLKIKMPAANLQIAALVAAKGYGLGWNFFQPGTEGRVHLLPEQVIRGRLIDLQGEGAAGVQVQVCRLGNRPAGGPGYYRLTVINKVNAKVVAATPGGKMMKAPPPADVPPPALTFVVPPAGQPFWLGTVTTDARGRFTLHGIGKGQGVGIQIRDPRYAMQSIDLPAPKDADTEITRVVSQARLLEGTLTDADTGKPIGNARLNIPSPGNGFGAVDFVLAGGLVGDVDWKGRRTNYNGIRSFAFFDNGSPMYRSDALPPINVRTDKQGRFRIPLSLANAYNLNITAAEGEPYFPLTHNVNWPKAAAKQTLKLTLHRGIWVRGKVTEAGSNKPLAGASVDFWGPTVKISEGVTPPRTVHTKADGTFEVLTPPGTWHLMVNGAVSEFVVQKVPAAKVIGNQPLRVSVPNGPVVTVNPGDAKKFFYPDGYQALELKPRADRQEVEIKLRREVLRGKLVGPDGKPATKAVMFYRHPLPMPTAAQPAKASGRVNVGGNFVEVWGMAPYSTEPAVAPIAVKDGWFEVPVRDLDAKYQLFFLDAGKELCGRAEVSFKQAQAKTPTVRLGACGSAKAKFVDGKGKPLAKYNPDLWLLLPPGPHGIPHYPAFNWATPATNMAFSPDGRALVVARSVYTWQLNGGSTGFDQILWRQADPLHYGKGRVTDAKGEITFPALIAGPDYRLVTSDGQLKNFKVESGKTLDLAKFVIKPPAPPKQPPANVLPPLAIKVVPPPVAPKPVKEKTKK